ncbi:MAG: response regulator [Desulfobacterales bacterium]|nr:response regulator [Desulfobacterales bacterium]
MERKKISVLALYDDHEELEILRRYLGDMDGMDAKVFIFTDWKSALDELSITNFNVIILDCLFENKTGLEVLKEIRNKGYQQPIILITNQRNENIFPKDIGNAEADDYLLKNELNSNVLRKSINGAIINFNLRKENAILSVKLQHSQNFEMIGTIAGEIAHNFNNMLGAITGYIELLKLKYKGSGNEAIFDSILQTSEKMATLIRKLVIFGRKEQPEWSFISINEIIKGIEIILKHTFPKDISVKAKILEQTLNLKGNSSMIKQSVLNICSNAADAMPYGGILSIIAKKIKINDLEHGELKKKLSGDHVLIQIKDTGVGINSQIQKKIFEPFFTTKKFTAKRGTGLGLSVAWSNIEAHKGFIDVKSKIGEGSLFSIYIPINL